MVIFWIGSSASVKRSLTVERHVDAALSLTVNTVGARLPHCKTSPAAAAVRAVEVRGAVGGDPGHRGGRLPGRGPGHLRLQYTQGGGWGGRGAEGMSDSDGQMRMGGWVREEGRTR
jgi:hypothetical protein